ncbi:hypothetical protein NEFER03_1101 [Nematocida sp. LUAm3]|nr:hypothetical protein NEFER03_1101 [Nematocida sp. LUAm3]KAI5175294.1 hypothetical protein NEFER02_1223 [Nematocida sp. LUAm2]KAI5177749.1 hypothetical protein NEFER01_0973 [Nematocida sp. LUAm1]
MVVEIYALECANKRGEEITRIEREIDGKRKKKMLFQTLPFHKRRRTASFDERRLPKKDRRGERNKRRRVKQRIALSPDKLRAHTWYSKRFCMYKNLDVFLPIKRNMKSDSFISAAIKTRGVLFDISYWKVSFCPPEKKIFSSLGRALSFSLPNERKEELVYPLEDDINKQSASIEENTLNSANINVDRHIVLEDEKGESPSICTDVDFKKSETQEDLCLFLLMGKRKIYEGSAYYNCDSLEEILSWRKEDCKKSAPYMVVRMDEEKAVLVMKKEACMEVLDKCVRGGVVPCSVLELFRIGTEKQKIVYPYDFPSTERGYDLYAHLEREEREKKERTPPGKRPVLFGKTFEDEVSKCVPYLFIAKKGIFPMGSPIVISDRKEEFTMTGEEKIIGMVWRSSFCFSRGSPSGVIWMNKEFSLFDPAKATLCTQKIFARNIRTKVFREIEVLPFSSETIL